MQEGCDMTVLHRHLATLRRKNKYAEAGMLECIAASATWPALVCAAVVAAAVAALDAASAAAAAAIRAATATAAATT